MILMRVDLEARARTDLRMGAIFSFLAFILAVGPMSSTGNAARDLFPPDYVGPSSILIDGREPYYIDVSLYWEKAGFYKVESDPRIVADLRDEGLVLFAPDFQGEANITLYARGDRSWEKVTLPVLVYPNVDSDRVRRHNAPHVITLD